MQRRGYRAGVDGGVSHHRRRQPHGSTDGVNAVEQALFVLLQIAIVCHRQSLQQSEQRHEVADETAAFTTGDLGDVLALEIGRTLDERASGEEQIGEELGLGAEEAGPWAAVGSDEFT